MKKLLLTSLVLLSSIALSGCTKPKETEYTHEAYMHMLMERSFEPDPYVSATLKDAIGENERIISLTKENNKWSEPIEDVVDYTFSLLYLEESELSKYHFYATKMEYRITSKRVKREAIYADVTYSEESIEFKYDYYGLPLVKKKTLFEKDGPRKLVLKQTYTYSL